MAEWLFQNLGTVIISAALIAVIALVVFFLVREKKKGKSSCGSACESCALYSKCHGKPSLKNK